VRYPNVAKTKKVGWIDIDKRGDVYDEDCDIDGDVFYERVAKRLIPDI